MKKILARLMLGLMLGLVLGVAVFGCGSASRPTLIEDINTGTEVPALPENIDYSNLTPHPAPEDALIEFFEQGRVATLHLVGQCLEDDIKPNSSGKIQVCFISTRTNGFSITTGIDDPIWYRVITESEEGEGYKVTQIFLFGRR